MNCTQVALFKTRLHQRRLDHEANVELLRVDSPRSELNETASEPLDVIGVIHFFSIFLSFSFQFDHVSHRSSHSLERPEDRNDRHDPTLVAMAGANARHFVPEKLPWQVRCNVT